MNATTTTHTHTHTNGPLIIPVVVLLTKEDLLSLCPLFFCLPFYFILFVFFFFFFNFFIDASLLLLLLLSTGCLIFFRTDRDGA